MSDALLSNVINHFAEKYDSEKAIVYRLLKASQYTLKVRIIILRENNICIGLLSFENLFLADLLPCAFIDNTDKTLLQGGRVH